MADTSIYVSKNELCKFYTYSIFKEVIIEAKTTGFSVMMGFLMNSSNSGRLTSSVTLCASSIINNIK